MPFVKEERYMGFVSESDAHADKTDLAIETLSDDVSKLRAEVKALQSKLDSVNTPSKSTTKSRTSKAKS